MEEDKKKTAKKHMLLLTLSIIGLLMLLAFLSVLTHGQ